MLRMYLFTFVFCGSFLFAETASEQFEPFTGRVLGNKVRMRTKADLDSNIIRQYNKNDLVLVIGEEDEFYAVETPEETKAYIYRCYVIDNVVEANRVNIRLEPHIDAPVIGQLQCNDRIESRICEMNNKWLEIRPPKGIKFYISKEFVERAGSINYFVTMQKRLDDAKTLLHSGLLMLEVQCNKSYEEMSPEETISKFDKLIKEFGDFPDYVEQAKEGLSMLQENYLQKKIHYLEKKANTLYRRPEPVFPEYEESNETANLFNDPEAPAKIEASLYGQTKIKEEKMTGKMMFWEPVEEALYLGWSAFHPEKKQNDFYLEQEVNGIALTGVVEVYEYNMKNRPGDYILRNDRSPVAYLYSTKVDLSKHVGEKITVNVSARPNHHFAFPAYFVHSIE